MSASNTGIIKVALQIKDDGTVRVLKSTGRESEKTGKKGTKAFRDMDKSSRKFAKGAGMANTAMLKIAGAAAGLLGVAAIWSKLKASVAEYVSLASTQEEAEQDLAAVLRSTGHAAGYNIDQLKVMASAMQSITRTGDEVILAGMSILATFKQVRGEAFERATMAALDMSRIMKQDLKSSMVMIGKALNDPTVGLTALSRAGVTFTEQQKDMIKEMQEAGDVIGAQTMILKELESQFGGAAQAAAGTFAGGLDQAKNALGDTKEELGYVITKNQFFIELTHLATQEFKEWGEQIKENRTELMKLAKGGVIKIVDALGLAIETMRFFHNGWLGIMLVGNAAVHAIAVGMDELFPIMRRMLLPMDALFEGLKHLGVVASNPFDKARAAFNDFRISSKDVTKDVLADIEKTNFRYDGIKRRIQGWKDKIVEIPATQVAADEKTRRSVAGTLDELALLQDKYKDDVIGNLKAIAAAYEATSLVKRFGDASRSTDGMDRAIEAYVARRNSAIEQFEEDYKRATLSAYDYERDQLRARYEDFSQYVLDKQALNEWYAIEQEKIAKKEAEAARKAAEEMAEANKTLWDEMTEAVAGWADTFAGHLNDLVWDADKSFGDILESFGRMLTEMVIKEQAAKPLMQFASWGMQSFGSWLFSVHGNAFDPAGHIAAYGHGGTFTNKVVDRPTMFAHGGGLGVMGEVGPEVIAPLFRASNGDMGVKAQVSYAPVEVYVIDQRTGSSPDVEVSETQGPDGRQQVRILIREEVKGAMADGSMDKTMRSNYGLQRAGIRR